MSAGASSSMRQLMTGAIRLHAEFIAFLLRELHGQATTRPDWGGPSVGLGMIQRASCFCAPTAL